MPRLTSFQQAALAAIQAAGGHAVPVPGGWWVDQHGGFVIEVENPDPQSVQKWIATPSIAAMVAKGALVEYGTADKVRRRPVCLPELAGAAPEPNPRGLTAYQQLVLLAIKRAGGSVLPRGKAVRWCGLDGAELGLSCKGRIGPINRGDVYQLCKAGALVLYGPADWRGYQAARLVDQEAGDALPG